MSSIDQCLLTYSQEVENERETQKNRLDGLSDQLINDITNEEEKSEYSAVNDRVRQILSDPNTCFSMTGFTPTDIEQLVTVSENIFSTSRRGRRIQLYPIDFIVILLQYLRCYPHFERGAFLFNLKPATYEKYVKTALESLWSVFVKEFITTPAEHCDLPISPHFPEASYVVDATVQKINTPIDQFNDAKLFYSGKHYCYCLKSQVIVDVMGAALDVIAGIPGSQHDMNVFKKNYKSFNERIISNHPNTGSMILADKGYISNEYESILITPFKGKPSNLDDFENDFNSKIASAREVVERFFGRMKSKFSIMNQLYRGDRDDYHKYFSICAALTNFDIRQCDNPLTKDDSEFYQRLVTIMIYIEKKRYERNLEIRKEQRIRRLGKINKQYQ